MERKAVSSGFSFCSDCGMDTPHSLGPDYIFCSICGHLDMKDEVICFDEKNFDK